MVFRRTNQQKIPFVQGFKREGPKGATCIDGRWSPDEKPTCIPGKHPENLYIFRGKRSLSGDRAAPRVQVRAQLEAPFNEEVEADSHLREIVEKNQAAKESERRSFGEEQEERKMSKHKNPAQSEPR